MTSIAARGRYVVGVVTGIARGKSNCRILRCLLGASWLSAVARGVCRDGVVLSLDDALVALSVPVRSHLVTQECG